MKIVIAGAEKPTPKWENFPIGTIVGSKGNPSYWYMKLDPKGCLPINKVTGVISPIRLYAVGEIEGVYRIKVLELEPYED